MNIRDKIDIETSEHAFLGKTDFLDTVKIRRQSVYIDVSQTKHGIRQEKTSLLLLTCFSSLLQGSGWLRAYQTDYVIDNNVEPAVI